MSWALKFFLTDQRWEKIIIRKSTWKYFWYLPTIVKDWIGYNKPVILFLTRTLAHDESDFYCESTYYCYPSLNQILAVDARTWSTTPVLFSSSGYLLVSSFNKYYTTNTHDLCLAYIHNCLNVAQLCHLPTIFCFRLASLGPSSVAGSLVPVFFNFVYTLNKSRG